MHLNQFTATTRWWFQPVKLDSKLTHFCGLTMNKHTTGSNNYSSGLMSNRSQISQPLPWTSKYSVSRCLNPQTSLEVRLLRVSKTYSPGMTGGFWKTNVYLVLWLGGLMFFGVFSLFLQFLGLFFDSFTYKTSPFEMDFPTTIARLPQSFIPPIGGFPQLQPPLGCPRKFVKG